MKVFTNSEITYMTALGLHVNFKDCSADNLEKIMEVVKRRLLHTGFDDEYKPNAEGNICEDIITKVTAHPNW